MTQVQMSISDYLAIIDTFCQFIPKPAEPMMFAPSEHALKWCKGKGVEIGPSIHNRMTPHAETVTCPDWLDFAHYAANQVKASGDYVKPDFFREGDYISALFPGNLDFVCSSHVLEHFPNPIKAFIDWCFCVRNGGIIYTVVPHRDALETDKVKPLTEFKEMQMAFAEDWTVERAPKDYERRGHYYRWSAILIQQMMDFVRPKVKSEYGWDLRFVDYEEIDVVGNGHIWVMEVIK